MKAIVCTQAGGPEVLKLQEVPEPRAGKGELVIAVRATALNGADLLQRRGAYPPPPGASELLGLEASGEVSEVGEGVQRFKKGDRVMALLDGGGYAEKVAVPEGMVMPLPEGFTFEQGAAVPEAWITAYLELIMLGQLAEGQAILIHAGASGVGAASIQIAKALGAKVFVTASSTEKLDFCKRLGADVAINYKEQDFAEVAREHTAEKDLPAIPGGGMKVPGVDVILDLVGASHFEKNIQSLTVEGRLLLVGVPSGSKAECDLRQVMTKRLRIIGSTLRARPKSQKVEIVRKFADFALAKLASGDFQPQVDKSFPLVEASQAHDFMEAKRNKGKIILTVA